jgi:electron transfer flavoprotein alpha/beta subunit
VSDVPHDRLPTPRAGMALSDTEHHQLVAVVTAASTHGSAALRRLWDDLVAAYGAEAASRVWQEALSSSDVGQT